MRKSYYILLLLYLVMMIFLFDEIDIIIATYGYYSVLGSEEMIYENNDILNKLIFHIIVNTIKVAIFLMLLLLPLLKNKKNHSILIKVALIMFFVFMYFDLPVHKYYNGNFETVWELGGHLH